MNKYILDEGIFDFNAEKQEQIEARRLEAESLALECEKMAKVAREQGNDSAAETLEERAKALKDFVNGIKEPAPKTAKDYDNQMDGEKESNKNEQETDTGTESETNDKETEQNKNKVHDKTTEVDPNAKTNAKSGNGEQQSSVQSNSNSTNSSNNNNNNKPEQPTDPEDPEKPTDPGNPGNPKDPGEPGEPGNPADPGDQGEPGNPSEPGDPTDPNGPRKLADDNDDRNNSKSSRKINNPFERDPREEDPRFQQPNPEQNQQDEKVEDATLQDLITMLKALKGASKDGAKQALKDILDRKFNVKVESLTLTEDVKPISQMSENEWDIFVDDTLNLVKQFDKGIEIEQTEDRTKRISKIKTDMNSAAIKRELDDEDRANLKDEKKALKAKKKESERYNRYPPINQFGLAFYTAIADQVKKVRQKYSTYAALNRHHEDDMSVIRKGDKHLEIPKEELPSVDVFLDCSISFEEEDIIMERRIISTIDEFVQRGEVVLNIYYFANHLHPDYESARAEGGTSAWPYIIDQINGKPKTKNVVIITDSDMNYQCRKYPTTYVDGCVWYIWKESDAENMPKKLIGGAGTYQYKF